jgi:hypothetical protein
MRAVCTAICYSTVAVLQLASYLFNYFTRDLRCCMGTRKWHHWVFEKTKPHYRTYGLVRQILYVRRERYIVVVLIGDRWALDPPGGDNHLQMNRVDVVLFRWLRSRWVRRRLRVV